MITFNAKEVKDRIVAWIREWFNENGKECNAIIGISGGTDSSVVAALCVEALGANRVFGVLMPQNTQYDIDYAYELCNHLKIKHCTIDIGATVSGLLDNIWGRCGIEISKQTEINLPPRIRMATLYAVSQSMNGRVANTCNLSEDWIGYSTRYGDSVGDFSPLSRLTKTEVKEIGKILNLPNKLIYKIPSDGLCGKTDEDNFGFTYDVLDKYIRTGEIEDMSTKSKIDTMHEKNMFKLQLMPVFEL